MPWTLPSVKRVDPGSFEATEHFYPRVPNALLHPLVRHFLTLGNERIARRYCHLHPEVDPAAVDAVLLPPKSSEVRLIDLSLDLERNALRLSLRSA